MNSLWWHFVTSGVETWLWLPPLAALIISFFTSMAGISGAFLLIPFQITIFGFASPAASATNLVYNLFAIPGGMWRYAREGRLLWSLALLITLGSAPGTLIGAWLRIHWLNERSVFEPFAALILLYLAWRLWQNWREPQQTSAITTRIQHTDTTLRFSEFTFGSERYHYPNLPLLGLSFLIAIIGTAYGIGGGAFLVPLCLTRYRLPVHAIAGATLTATFLTSTMAIIAYTLLTPPPGMHVQPDWALGIAFGLGGLLGSYLGARLQRHIPQQHLKISLTLLLLLLGIHYLLP